MAGERIQTLRLFVLREQADGLLQELILSGCAEILPPDAAIAAALSPERGAADAQRVERDALQRALDILAECAPEKPRLFSSKAAVLQETFLDFRGIAAAQLRAERIAGLADRIREETEQQVRIRAQIAELQPWAAWDVPLDCPGTAQCSVVFGTAPASVRLSALRNALRAVTEAAELTLVSKDRSRQYLELICFRSMRQRCTEALRRFGFCEIAFAVSGTAAEALAAANEALAQTAQTIKDLREELSAMAAFRQELQLGFDRLTLRIAAETAKDLLCATAQTVCLHAVTAAQNTGRLDAMFARFGCAWEWSDPDPVRAGRLQPLAFAPRYTEILAGIQ